MAVIFRINTDDMNSGKLEERGIYKVEVKSLKPEVSKSGKDMVNVAAEVVEGEHKGKMVYKRIMIPTADMKWPRFRWLEMLGSFGHSVEEAKAIMDGGVDDEQHILGQQGWIEFTPAVGEGSFSETEWVTEKEATSRAAIVAEAAAARADMEDVPF
jgi:hypothetical protein